MSQRRLSGSYTKKGPGRYHINRTARPAGSKLWRKCPLKRPDFNANQGDR
jgi:hypothetical protein